MSRAFVKEIERDETIDVPDPVLPAGAPNLVTPDGAARLRAEHEVLRAERAARKASGRPEDEPWLRAADRRLAWFERRSQTWVEAPRPEPGVVRLGSRVTWEDPDGKDHTVRIVGVDEVDGQAGAVSWLAPVATALLGARVGDTVTLKRPAGDQEVEVVAIA